MTNINLVFLGIFTITVRLPTVSSDIYVESFRIIRRTVVPTDFNDAIECRIVNF